MLRNTIIFKPLLFSIVLLSGNLSAMVRVEIPQENIHTQIEKMLINH